MARTARPTPAAKTNVVQMPERKRRPGLWRTLLATAMRIPPRWHGRDNARRPNPFTPAVPLPGVIGKDAKAKIPQIAMDAAKMWEGALDDPGLAGSPGWVGSYAQAYAASAYAEGQEWLGYAVLAILSQRPEYRIATEVYATDMTREWIAFKSKSDDDDKQDKIDQLVARLSELKLKEVIKAAVENDGFQGRGQVYIDTGDADDRDELKTPIGDGGKESQAKFGKPDDDESDEPGRIGDAMAHDFDPIEERKRREKERAERGKRRKIKRLAAIEPMWCYPSQYNADDPLKADWYRPEIWWVMGKEVHRSRLLTFTANPVPNMLMPAYSFGGLSRTQMMKPYVDFWLRNRTSGSDLLSNFSIPVLATDLDVTTMDEGSELFQRVMTFNVLRDNQSTMVINKDSEDFEIKQTSLAGVKDLVGQSAEHMCIPSRIPIVKFFGDQPGGLNASSEGVIRLWYDNVKADQEGILRPVIQVVVNLAMIEMWGEVDDDLEFEFVDLWQLDSAGKAAVQKTKADTRAIDLEAGVISAEEGRLAAAHDSDSQYVGLDLREPLPEPEIDPMMDPSLEGGEGGGEPGGQGGERGEVQRTQGLRPNRRDLAGLTGQAARFGGAVTGGFSAHDLRIAADVLDRLDGDSRAVPFDEWNEADHPRGQPENAGQFGPGGGGGERHVERPVQHKREAHEGVVKAREEFGLEWSSVKTDDPASEMFDHEADPEVVAHPWQAAENLIATYPEADRRMIADVDSKVRQMIADGKETEKLYRDPKTGEWSEERQQLHTEILTKIFDPEVVDRVRPVAGTKPKFVMLGGRGGSGKSWFTEEHGIGADALKLDNDEIKGMLPEYEGWNAALVHEEASYLFDRATDIAMAMGLNICHDATMKTTSEAVDLVKSFSDAGYVPEAHYMFCAPQEAARRALKRFVNGMKKNGRGRFVLPGYTMSSTTNERSFDVVKDLCKSWSLYDNNVWGREPQHVANGGRSKSWPARGRSSS